MLGIAIHCEKKQGEAYFVHVCVCVCVSACVHVCIRSRIKVCTYVCVLMVRSFLASLLYLPVYVQAIRGMDESVQMVVMAALQEVRTWAHSHMIQ